MAIRLKFIQDDTVEGVEVIIKAKSQDEEVQHLVGLLGGEAQDALWCQPLAEEVPIDVGDVVIISKDGRYLSVKTMTGEYVLSEPLYKMEERLDPCWFVKISQSEIVNLRYVRRWDFEGGGIIRIEMANGVKSYTSRRYAAKIREILGKGAKR